MAHTPQTSTQISVVDFGPFLDGSAKQEVADKMVSAFKEIGFVYLINHGIPEQKRAQMFEWSKHFFAQPMEVKKLAPHPPSGTHHRGYSSPGQEKVVQHVYDADGIAEQRTSAPDVKESFECGREGASVQPNIWLPDGLLPGFKEACLEFYSLCHEVELSILRALAMGLGISEEYFLQYHHALDNQLRLLHYPSVPLEALETEKLTRIGAHSDFGPWSNDTIRSTIHRVRAPPQSKTIDGMTPERYSIPYDFDTTVDCIPGTWNAERPKKYEPISAHEYIMKRMAPTY
ncbi:thymine dioxygenase [Mycena galopus ATCC 62051]|nr:thymine dioxygenase [Mycena galopus ATCC 62051]